MKVRRLVGDVFGLDLRTTDGDRVEFEEDEVNWNICVEGDWTPI